MATALARSACRLLFVPGASSLFLLCPAAGGDDANYRVTLRSLRRSTDYIANSTFLGFSPRLAKQLIVMLDDAGSAPNAALRISQTELASMLGVSRERVNRQLVAWANSSIIDKGRARVVVRDRRALGHVIYAG